MIKILSLFDGLSGAQIAINKLGIKDYTYYASEIDKYAIAVTLYNYPNTIQIGDITKVNGVDYKNIDLFIGGSPCQDLSISKKNRLGLNGIHSGLFWEWVRLLNEVKPKYFILENVNSMPKEAKELITKTLFGIEPVMINSSLVSAQQRKRLFWVGLLVKDSYIKVEIPQPEDKNIYLKDIINNAITEKDKSCGIDASYYKDTSFEDNLQKKRRQLVFNEIYSDYHNKTYYDKSRTIGASCGITRSSTCQQVITKPVKIYKIGKGGQGYRIYSIENKSVCLSASSGGLGAATGLYAIKDFVRKLTPIECERLQTILDNYTQFGVFNGIKKLISNSQRYKMLGNGFTVDVIVHILNFIFKNDK